jgi:hypothetical protein
VRAYSFASCLRMMLLDTALYFLLACYLDKVGNLGCTTSSRFK